MNAADMIPLIRETIRQFNEDKVPRLSGALAYSTVFSLSPLLVVVIAIAGAALGREAATGRIVGQLRGLVGTDGAQVIEDMIQNASQPDVGTFAGIIALITLLIGVSGVFGALQDALNTIWGVMPRPNLGLGYMLRSRVLSFALVLVISFLLLVALVISALLSAVDEYLNTQFPGGGVLLQVLNLAISLGVITVLFAVMFKYLPDVKIAWRDVWVGAFVTAILFSIGKFAIGLYLGNSSPASVYGAAGSLVVLLIWIYYSSLIFLFGAEFTQVYATRYGSHIQAAENAIPLTREARAHQGIPLRADVEAATELQDALNR